MSITSLSWHPTESVLAATLSSGTLLLSRIGERSDGERLDRPSRSQDLILANGHESYDGYSEGQDDEMAEESAAFEDSFLSKRGEEMIVDDEA